MVRSYIMISLLLFLPFLILASTEEESCMDKDNTLLQRNIIEWVKSSGGFFNPKLEFRRVIPDDPSSYFGIFAVEDIEEGELLVSVPWKCVITGFDEELDGDREHEVYCGATKRLIEEMQKGDDSDYAPYIKYLLQQPRGKFPSDWSESGKKLYLQVLRDKALPPENAVDLLDQFHRRCNERDGDPLKDLAAMEHWSRADEEDLVPLYDLFNHANGHANNCEATLVKEEKQEVTTTRPVAKGEQLRFSYNLSPHNIDEEAMDYYGTPEMLRDFGFVEPMPQKWIFHQQAVGFELVEEDGKILLHWLDWIDVEFDRELIQFFEASLLYLQQVVEPYLAQIEQAAKDNMDDTNKELPTQRELSMIRQYHDAQELALSLAVSYFDTPSAAALCRETDGGICNNTDMMEKVTYRRLALQDDDREADDLFNFPTYDDTGTYRNRIEVDSSVYQEIAWVHGKNKNDICFKLDGVTQTCSCFAPHYYEVAAHFPTRYLESVERVVIVGDPSLKMLQEMLKYPTITKVLHLELDQKPVRKSFKYFATQPHFDNERVEWRFGDPVQNLRLLPKEYFGTFDLVFVDLSDNNFLADYSVWEGITAWEALAKLVAPHGLFISGDPYLDTVSQMFDSTVLLYYEGVPLLQAQALTIGSNRKDLLSPDATTLKKWNEIKTIYEDFRASPKDLDEHLKYVHDYRTSDARALGACDPSPVLSADDDEASPAGLLLILEAENALANLKWPSLESSLLTVLKEAGLTSPSTLTHTLQDGGALCLIMANEGVVVTRTWPDEKYCAFDVYLWTSLDKLGAIKKRLTEVVESKAVSSYSMVASGVYGVSTLAEASEKLGPPIVQNRDCNAPDLEEKVIDEDTVAVVIEESLAMAPNKNGVVAVICGSESEPCASHRLLPKRTGFMDSVTIWTCPAIETFEYDEESRAHHQEMFSCEWDVLKKLQGSVSKDEKIVAFIFDETAPVNLVKILDRILKSRMNRKRLMSEQATFTTFSQDESETWRRDFLELRRPTMINDKHVHRAEVLLKSHSASLEVGFLSSYDQTFFRRLMNVTKSMETKTGLLAVVRNVEGGVEMGDPEQVPSRWYTEDDFDRKDGEAQFAEQRPLGVQHVIQLESNDGFMLDDLEELLTVSQRHWANVKTKHAEVGDGMIISSVSYAGSVVLVWDGDGQVHVNLFCYEPKSAESFLEAFWTKAWEKDYMEPVSHEEMPRGVGRVVNVFKDLQTSKG